MFCATCYGQITVVLQPVSQEFWNWEISVQKQLSRQVCRQVRRQVRLQVSRGEDTPPVIFSWDKLPITSLFSVSLERLTFFFFIREIFQVSYKYRLCICRECAVTQRIISAPKSCCSFFTAGIFIHTIAMINRIASFPGLTPYFLIQRGRGYSKTVALFTLTKTCSSYADLWGSPKSEWWKKLKQAP